MPRAKAQEWFALWRFASTEDAIRALPTMHISCGVGDAQGSGALADALEDEERLTICAAGGEIEVCLSFPYAHLNQRGAWISPSQVEGVSTYNLKGEDIKGDAYSWGKR